MPGVRIGTYAIAFYEYDLREPPHVHVRRERKEAKFWLDPIALERSRGFREHELRDIEKLLHENIDRLLALWYQERSKL